MYCRIVAVSTSLLSCSQYRLETQVWFILLKQCNCYQCSSFKCMCECCHPNICAHQTSKQGPGFRSASKQTIKYECNMNPWESEQKSSLLIIGAKLPITVQYSHQNRHLLALDHNLCVQRRNSSCYFNSIAQFGSVSCPVRLWPYLYAFCFVSLSSVLKMKVLSWQLLEYFSMLMDISSEC